MPPFCHRMAVRFADIDHAGLVYHPVFFDYFHVALEELFYQRLGPRSYADLLDVDRIGLPSVRSECEFRSPVRFGDTIEIELSLKRIGRSSVTLGYRVFRCADAGNSEPALAAEGSNTCAIVDLEAFRAVAIPAKLLTLFRDLESSGEQQVV